MKDVFDPLADIERALAAQAGWTWFDDYLLYTCGIVESMTAGRGAQIRSNPTRVRLEPGEICFADGGVRWFTWRGIVAHPGPAPRHIQIRTPLDAIYQWGADVQRQRVEAAAQPRWVAEPPGSAMISNRRIQLANPGRAFSVRWSTLAGIDLVAPDLVGCRFPDHSGAVQQLQIRTSWAPLVFVTAALQHFPHHPLLRNGTWLPAGFEDKCHLAGKKCPNVRIPG
ncbi:hypothetical protein ACFO5K_16855 [Nocardia halotolerans]|uniref:Uncharacterized protein n=1 Tax=Nocardia halotolerans TaxID=1755878 RepID=A0ABV8VK95_9NOCA